MNIATKLAIFILLSGLLYPLSGKTQTWYAAEPIGLPASRCENGMAEVNGKLYLIGGRGERPVEEYDPKKDAWTVKGQPPLEMHHFQAVSYNKEIYVMGAFTGPFTDEKPIPNLYIFNPEKNTWRQGPAIPEDRLRGAAGAFTFNDKLYLVCGIREGHHKGHIAWFDEFDPKTNTWKRLPDAPRARDHASVALLEGKLYVAGGRQTPERQLKNRAVPEMDIYDFNTGKWTTAVSPLPTLRAGNSTIVFEKKIVVLGGESDTQESAHREVEAFNPKSQQWEKMPVLLQGRHGMQAVVFNGKIFIAAGSAERGGGPELNTLEIYRK